VISRAPQNAEEAVHISFLCTFFREKRLRAEKAEAL
jgi:hypothetical protein